MAVLQRDLKLLIDDFGENPKLASPVHDYFRLLQDYRMRRAHFTFVIHTRGGYVGFSVHIIQRSARPRPGRAGQEEPSR